MSGTWRCFVAVPLADSLREALVTSAAAWRRQPPADALRWADPDGWHLTLAFLGDVDADAVPGVAATVRRVAAAHSPTLIRTGRLGSFPRPGSTRVLWHGVADPDGRLASLAGDLADALELEHEEPYRAHITLARARRRPIDLRGWIDEASASAPVGKVSVETVALMRSHLGRGPARYETLATFDLGGAT